MENTIGQIVTYRLDVENVAFVGNEAKIDDSYEDMAPNGTVSEVIYIRMYGMNFISVAPLS